MTVYYPLKEDGRRRVSVVSCVRASRSRQLRPAALLLRRSPIHACAHAAILSLRSDLAPIAQEDRFSSRVTVAKKASRTRRRKENIKKNGFVNGRKCRPSRRKRNVRKLYWFSYVFSVWDLMSGQG